MKHYVMATLAALAIAAAAVPAKAEGIYAGVGPFGVYVGPGYDYSPDWQWRHRYGYRYYHDGDWRYRHHYRYYRDY
jgi:hypothetical protein